MWRDETSCDQLRGGEERREDMRWDEITLRRHDVEWHEMRWDDADSTNNGTQYDAMNKSKRNFDAMRSGDMRKTHPWKRWWHRNSKSKKLLMRNKTLLPAPYRHGLRSALGVSNLKLPPPACPGTTCIVFTSLQLLLLLLIVVSSGYL